MNYIAVAIIIFGIVNLRYIKKILIPTIIYFLYTVISLIWSPALTMNWYVITNIVNFILFIVLTSHKWKNNELQFINQCIALSQIVVVIAVMKNISTLYSYRLNITIVSTMGISDFACGLCLLIAFLMNIIIKEDRLWIKSIAYVSLVFDIATIIMTGSRGAILMVAAMMLVWILGKSYSMRKKFIIAIFALFGYLMFDNYFMRLLPNTVLNRLSLDAVENSAGSGRFNIWALAWRKFLDSNLFRMFFGYGFNSFADTIKYGSFGGHTDMMAHNAVVQLLIEGGIIGELTLFSMVISQIKTAWKHNNSFMKFAVVGLFVSALSIDMQVTRIWGTILTLNYVYYQSCT